MSALVEQLLTRGDHLAVEHGRLTVTPHSGKVVPDDWYRKNRDLLMTEIACRLEVPVYRFTYYKTGIYNGSRSPGLMLRFADVHTEEDVFAIFNASLKRQRASRNGEPGEMLPDGQFRVGERSAFQRFWIRAGLELPCRIAEWYKSMFRLKALFFNGQLKDGKKLINKTITPLCVPAEQISALFGDNSALSQRQASVNSALSISVKDQRQEPALSTGVKESTQNHVNKGLEGNSKCVSEKVRVSESACDLTACVSNRVLSNQVIACNVVPFSPDKKDPCEQTNEEWLADYNSAKQI